MKEHIPFTVADVKLAYYSKWPNDKDMAAALNRVIPEGKANPEHVAMIAERDAEIAGLKKGFEGMKAGILLSAELTRGYEKRLRRESLQIIESLDGVIKGQDAEIAEMRAVIAAVRDTNGKAPWDNLDGEPLWFAIERALGKYADEVTG